MKKVLVLVCLFAMSTVVVLAEDAPAAPAKKAGGCKSCASCAGKDMDKGEVVQLADLPAAVKTAAEKSVEGIVLSEAKVMKKDDKSVYKIIGKANDKDYVVLVDSEGKVIKSWEKGEGKGKDHKEGGDKKHGGHGDKKDKKDKEADEDKQ